MTIENNTEKSILLAARKIFVLKGFDGARMQEIADEAGINKSLLHYYFRNKENLFDAIFIAAFSQIQANLSVLVSSDRPVLEKIEIFIDQYLDILAANPYLPAFIAHEINRYPDKIAALIQGTGLKSDTLAQQIFIEKEKGTILPVDIKHLIINLIALCVFPFIAKPLLDRLIFNNNEEQINEFYATRKDEIKNIIIRTLTKQP